GLNPDRSDMRGQARKITRIGDGRSSLTGHNDGMTTHTTPQKDRIERLNGPGRYGYRGWVISKQIRDWDARGYRGSTGNNWPKVSWETHQRGTPRWNTHMFRTRREAVAYIDE